MKEYMIEEIMDKLDLPDGVKIEQMEGSIYGSQYIKLSNGIELKFSNHDSFSSFTRAQNKIQFSFVYENFSNKDFNIFDAFRVHLTTRLSIENEDIMEFQNGNNFEGIPFKTFICKNREALAILASAYFNSKIRKGEMK
ncbi:MAG: hypothetical protein PHP62_05135 [Candidatus Moranbacteria bacterium]|nr:hypothetical protein [Candidatus Moranbacteria bacterium]